MPQTSNVVPFLSSSAIGTSSVCDQVFVEVKNWVGENSEDVAR